MARSEIYGVDLIAVNTDAQALYYLKNISQKILIGKKTTKGLGAGMNTSLGKKAAEENKEELSKVLRGSDMVFITCGLGGGTGSGAAPVIAEIAKDLNILTVVVVTLPFSFEGEQRKNVANQAILSLKGKFDSLLILQNDSLLKVIDEKTTVSNAFEICDETLKQAVQSITSLVLEPGIINIDFASVMSILRNSGRALFGMGKAKGEGRAAEATQMAINSPLVDFSMKGAKGVLFNVSGNDVSLDEIKNTAKLITENVDSRAKIIFGAIKDNSLGKGELKVSLIATKI